MPQTITQTLKIATKIADTIRDSLIRSMTAETVKSHTIAAAVLDKAIQKAHAMLEERKDELVASQNVSTPFGTRGEPEFKFTSIVDPDGIVANALMAQSYLGRETFAMLRGLGLTHCRENKGPDGKNIWIYEARVPQDLVRSGKQVFVNGHEIVVAP